MATPHITCNPGDFAKTVLLPGDPLRAKMVAETMLDDAVLVNNVRGVQGYTGTYHGKKVSVMASGMGIPSIGIYSYELFHYFDVDNIIRIGTAGALSPKLKVRDIVAGMSAYTDSNFQEQYGFKGHMAPCCSYELLAKAMEVGKRLGQEPIPGALLSSDVFYSKSQNSMIASQMGVLAVEMESAGLYLNAAEAGKNALCLCTISDHVLTGESLSAEDRQLTFKKMIEIALEIA